MLLFLFLSALVNAEQWAVLIAGSNGYYNYRHQADLSHAYKILTDLGKIPEDNIIMMMFDDVASSDQNPVPGELINRPNGENVYPGSAAVDYSGEHCTAKNVLKVLKGSASGKHLKSTEIDDVFVYFTDHGAPGLVAMPTNPPLYADDLLQTFATMKKRKMFRQMVVYIEACESGSMLMNLTNDLDIFGTTAATNDEPSYATYWDNERKTYLGDEYSVNWMEDTENHWSEMESLMQQYNDVVKAMNHSHPQKFGDFTWTSESIKLFQSEMKNAKASRRILDSHPHAEILETSSSRDIVINTLRNRAKLEEDPLEFLRIREDYRKEHNDRVVFDTIFRALTLTLVKANEFDDYLNKVLITDINYPCLKTMYDHFQTECKLWSDYGLKYVKTFVNICGIDDIETSEIQDATTSICANMKMF